jgi:hypothetical protein
MEFCAMELTALQRFVWALISTYIDRQSLVKQALYTLKPSIFYVGQSSLSVEELVVLVQTDAKVPSTGYLYLDDKWEYYLHGSGCKLVNQDTLEPLEWDAPDVEIFDRYWFAVYATWWINTGQLDQKINQRIQRAQVKSQLETEMLILSIVNELEQLSLLRAPDSHNPNKLMKARALVQQ